MPSLVEFKAEAIYYAVRTLGECYLAYKSKPLNLAVNPPDPVNAADVFHTEARRAHFAFKTARTPFERAKAAAEFCQQQVNLADFPGARRTALQIGQLSATLPLRERDYFKAVEEGQFGWIADYETGYADAFRHFNRLRGILGRRKTTWTAQEANLDSTAVHFLGRATLGLACQEIDVRNNTDRARSYFLQDLSRCEQMRQDGNPQPANEGFQHAWLTRCNLTVGDLSSARESAKRTREFFEESLDLKPSGIMAHYYLLEGAINLRGGDAQTARNDFLQSIKIRTEIENYPMGLAFAYLGVAKTYLQEGELRQSLNHLRKAVQTQPFILLYGINGRYGG